MLHKFETLEPRNLLSAVRFVQHDLPKIDFDLEAYTGDMHVLDVDGDGDLDVVGLKRGSGNDQDVFVVENLGSGKFRQIDWELKNKNTKYRVRASWWGDYDSDGDADVFTDDGNIYENVGDGLRLHDSLGEFFLTTDAEWADMDDDGDLDLLGLGSFYPDWSTWPPTGQSEQPSVWWRENLDGKGDFGEREKLLWNEGLGRVGFADFDGDGRSDVWAATPPLCEDLAGQTEFFWVPGLGGGVFAPPIEMTFRGINSLCSIGTASVGDIDQDGDLDVVISRESIAIAGFSWVENVDSETLAANENRGLRVGSLVDNSLVDVDLDGDLDVLGAYSASLDFGGGCDCLLWYENDGGSLASEGHVIGPVPRLFAFVRNWGVGDIDSDGDVDVVGHGWWYENTAVDLTPDLVGDLDADDMVGFSDFLILSSNFGRDDDDLTPAHGDLDRDGLVGFSDFLILAANFGSPV